MVFIDPRDLCILFNDSTDFKMYCTYVQVIYLHDHVKRVH